jgi:hypothetical protein
MHLRHRPGHWFRLLSAAPVFAASRRSFEATNLVFGRWGNKLGLGAVRNEADRS